MLSGFPRECPAHLGVSEHFADLHHPCRLTLHSVCMGPLFAAGLMEQAGVQAAVPTLARQQPIWDLSFAADGSVSALLQSVFCTANMELVWIIVSVALCRVPPPWPPDRLTPGSHHSPATLPRWTPSSPSNPWPPSLPTSGAPHSQRRPACCGRAASSCLWSEQQQMAARARRLPLP